MRTLFCAARVLAHCLSRVERWDQTHHPLRGYPEQLMRLSALLYPHFPRGREWVRGWGDRRVAHLQREVSTRFPPPILYCSPERTPFSDFGKRQTGTPLQVNVLAVYERAQRIQGVA